MYRISLPIISHTHTVLPWLSSWEVSPNSDASEQWGDCGKPFVTPNPQLHWMIFINYDHFRKCQVNDVSHCSRAHTPLFSGVSAVAARTEIGITGLEYQERTEG